MSDVHATPATRSSSTNLSEYRALLQVLGFAAESKHSSSDVVSNAVMGGVVSLYQDASMRTPFAVLLPSPKSVSVMAPLIAEGFFSPSLSFTLDNPLSTRYQPLTETLGRDGFTLVFLMFPDCFADVACLASALPRSVAAGSTPAAAAPDVSSSQSTRYSAANSRSLTPKLPAPASAATATSPSASASTSIHGAGTKILVDAADPRARSRSPREQTVPSTGTPVSRATPPASLPAGTPATVPVCADVLQLHRLRLQIAVSYLCMVNDTLHDVQVRQLQVARRSDAKTERATLGCVQSLTEKTKALLLACICTSEVAYRRLQDVDITRDRSFLLAAALSAGAGAEDAETPATAVQVDPRQLLTQRLCGSCFSQPVEHWEVWGQTTDQAAAWYDALLVDLQQLFASSRTVTHPSSRGARDGLQGDDSFGIFLNQLRANSLRTSARITSKSPEPLLYRATDGHHGVWMKVGPTIYSRPVVPHMPLQSGELTSFFCPHDECILFDATPSVVIPTLTGWARHKLSEKQVQEESKYFFDEEVPAWVDTAEQRRAVITELLAHEETVAHMLEKNPVVLARLTLWAAGLYGTAPVVPVTSPTALDHSPLAMRIVETALFTTPFAVSTGYFVRELVSHGGLTLELFVRWASHLAESVKPSTASSSAPSARTILALVDLVVLSARWQVVGPLKDSIAHLRQKLK